MSTEWVFLARTAEQEETPLLIRVMVAAIVWLAVVFAVVTIAGRSGDVRRTERLLRIMTRAFVVLVAATILAFMAWSLLA